MTRRSPLPFTVPPEPWERQPGETARAYAIFTLYRDMEPAKRQKSAVARQIGIGARQIHKWVAKYHWDTRCAAWDREQERLRRLENRLAVRQMAERHATVSMLMQQKAIEKLQIIDSKYLNPDQAARIYEAAVRIERVARGAPDSITEQHRYDETGPEAQSELRLNAEVMHRIMANPKHARVFQEFLDVLEAHQTDEEIAPATLNGMSKNGRH